MLFPSPQRGECRAERGDEGWCGTLSVHGSAPSSDPSATFSRWGEGIAGTSTPCGHARKIRRGSCSGLLGRGAGKCRRHVFYSDAFQRPVRRFLSATSVSLLRQGPDGIYRRSPECFGGRSSGVPSGSWRSTTPHMRTQRAITGSRNIGSVRDPRCAPCRQGKTIFCGPRMGRFTSFLRIQRRSASPRRLAV